MKYFNYSKETGKKMVDLPDKSIEVIRFPLTNKEKCIYDKIFSESKEKVKTFLRNRQLGRSNQSGSVSEILVYLLRLRQCCCHMVLLIIFESKPLNTAYFKIL